MIPWVAACVGRSNWKHYLAYDGTTPIATAAMYIQDGYCWFDFASTLADYRGRGAQSLLIGARIRECQRLGCNHLTVETAEQTQENYAPSYRNITRNGFQEAFKRPIQ